MSGSRDVEYMTNETAGVAAFVQEGDLWSFDPEDGKTIRIFSFRRDEGDFRDARNQHNIKSFVWKITVMWILYCMDI